MLTEGSTPPAKTHVLAALCRGGGGRWRPAQASACLGRRGKEDLEPYQDLACSASIHSWHVHALNAPAVACGRRKLRRHRPRSSGVAADGQSGVAKDGAGSVGRQANSAKSGLDPQRSDACFPATHEEPLFTAKVVCRADGASIVELQAIAR